MKRARVVVYDGDCGFCGRWVRVGRALDWLGRLEWRPRLDPDLLKDYPQLSNEETQNRMVSILPDGRTRGGFYAVRDVALQTPVGFLPGLILSIPGMALLGVPAYGWVSRNRRRFGGNACEIKRK